eukprot:2208306-Amphidinium_carterae.1
MPTIHENARVDPLTVDDPWTRVRNVGHAAGVSVDEDLGRARSRQFHGNDRHDVGSGFPIPTTTYDIYTPIDDASMPQACRVNPNYQSVSHPPTIPHQMLQQHTNMDVESGIFIESGPQMWYPPSTHQHGYIQGRQQTTYFPSQVQGQSLIFSMAPPNLGQVHRMLGSRFLTPHVTQGFHLDPWELKGHLTHLTFKGQPQPREASSIDLPELPTPPRFKSWRAA